VSEKATRIVWTFARSNSNFCLHLLDLILFHYFAILLWPCFSCPLLSIQAHFHENKIKFWKLTVYARARRPLGACSPVLDTYFLLSRIFGAGRNCWPE